MRAGLRRLLAAVLPVSVLVACAPVGDNLAGEAGAGEPGEALAPWAWQLLACVAYDPAAYQAAGHRISATASSGEAVDTITEVYEPGWGPRAVAEIQVVLQTCHEYESGGGEPAGTDYPDGFREQHIVVESGFAGEESLLVEIIRLAPPAPMAISYAAVVRDGDTVVTLRAASSTAAELMCLAGAREATCSPRRT